MSRTLLFLVGLGMLVALLPNASADDGGLKIPFNPFSDTEEKVEPRTPPSNRMTKKATEEKTNEGGFAWPSYLKPKLPSLPKPSMPKLSLPSMASSSKPKSRGMEEPSTWEKINTGTKNLVTSTKNTLMPWTADEKATTSRTTMRKQSTVKASSRSKPKTEKKSILSSWFSPKEEEKPIETVNDYLALPRVPY